MKIRSHKELGVYIRLTYLDIYSNNRYFIEYESDLIVPYSNHFEHLKGERKSECSLRINDQWRICFRFENGNVYDAGIEDYH
ncbi:MAG: type II toxin-antitoxin system RelE/ParE family toxin [Ignavibacteriaceae bacterium]